MTKKQSYILGNSGFAKELFDQTFSTGTKQFNGFITLKDDKAYILNEQGTHPFFYPKNVEFILGTGNKKWRKTFIDHFTSRYEPSTEYFPNIIHSTAYISSLSSMGIGNVFCPFSLVNGDAKMGSFNCFNIYSTISHDCIIGNHNIMSPYSGLMGRCTMQDTNFLGTNSIITPDTKLGSDNTISAGEVVFDDMCDREFFQSGLIYKKR